MEVDLQIFENDIFFCVQITSYYVCMYIVKKN